MTEADIAGGKLGARFNRLDLSSRLALLAVEALGINFDGRARDRIGICLATVAGSLATDVEYWKGRALVGGPSPTLFAYTLPSAPIGEIAIRHGLKGPNLCFVGDDDILLFEAGELILRGDADACVCVFCDVTSAEVAEIIRKPPMAGAKAWFLERGIKGNSSVAEIGRDTASACAKVRAQESVS